MKSELEQLSELRKAYEREATRLSDEASRAESDADFIALLERSRRRAELAREYRRSEAEERRRVETAAKDLPQVRRPATPEERALFD